MKRFSKALIAGMVCLSAVALVLLALATWIISAPPQTWFPTKTGLINLYIGRVVGMDYQPDGITTSDQIAEKLAFYDESGKTVTDVPLSLVFSWNADGRELTTEQSVSPTTPIMVGSTYMLRISNQSDVETALQKQNYTLVGTCDGVSGGSLINPQKQTTVFLVLKYQSVSVSGKLYTIEDALAQKTNATVKGDTSFASAAVAKEAGYYKDERTPDTQYYTVASGATLLLPFSDSDTEGYIHPTWNFGDDTSNLPSNANGKKLYQTVTIPAGISVTNAGTMTIGAFTGQKGNNHIGGISGGFAELVLNGSLSSTGTLNVYGNITGRGTINATSGTVLERFEILDWPGGTIAGARFVGNGSVAALRLLQNGSVVSVSNPNEFPFEHYTMEAINGPTLTIHYGVVYEGNARIFTGQLEKAGQKIPPMLSIANLKLVNVAKSDTADGLIGLKRGATAIKKIVNGRNQITITGGMVGGIATLYMDLLRGSIEMDTAKVKFPISKLLDIILNGGSSSSKYGYEIMKDAAVRLTGGASLTLTNSEDGTIAYEKDPNVEGDVSGVISVGANCTLTVQGKFGGTVEGEDGATLDFQATPSNSGYIGGSGSYDVNLGGAFGSLFGQEGGIDFTFTGDPTTVNAQGKLYPSGGEGQFASGHTYYHNGTCWVGDDADFHITYQYYYRDSDGVHQITDTSPVGDASGNRTVYQPKLGTVQLSSNGLTYDPDDGETWTFVGWYSDPDCTRLVSSFNARDIEDKTFYGLFELGHVYVFNFNTNYNTLDGGTLTQSGAASGIGYQVGRSSTGHLESYIESLSESSAAIRGQDADKTKQYYFAGWYLENGEPLTADALEARYGTPSDQDVSVNVYAVWKEKAHITVTDEGATGEGYFKPGDVVNLTELHDPRANDENTRHATYFSGWIIDSAYEDYLKSEIDEFTVPEGANGAEIAIGTERREKVTVTFSDPAVDYNETFYYRVGDNVTAEGYDNKNDDPTVQTYFKEWKLDGSDVTFTTYYHIPEGTVGPLNFTAERKAKVEITFKDSQYGSATGYFVPGTPVNLNAMVQNVTNGFDPHKGDYDPTVSTYFTGEWLDPNNEKIEGGTYYVPAADSDGNPTESAVTVTTERVKKAKIELKSNKGSGIDQNCYQIECGTQTLGGDSTELTNAGYTFYLKSDQTATVTGYARTSTLGFHTTHATNELTLSNSADGAKQFEEGKSYTCTLNTVRSGRWPPYSYTATWTEPIDNGLW